MPCTKQMRGCAATCLHRAMVEDYRLARYNEELLRERVTLGWTSEETLYREEHGPLITFKDWLVGLTNPRPDAVSTLPEAALDSATAEAWAA